MSVGDGSVQIQICDFNQADKLFTTQFGAAWADVEAVLTAMPLYLKESDQAGIQGSLIFDPVGTNAHIKEGLQQRGWHTNVPLPAEYSFLGTDVDFIHAGVLGEDDDGQSRSIREPLPGGALATKHHANKPVTEQGDAIKATA
jgi:hypothetical protein